MGKEICDFNWQVSRVAIHKAFKRSLLSGFNQLKQEGVNVASYFFKERPNPEEASFPTTLERRTDSVSGKERLYWPGYDYPIVGSMKKAAGLARLLGRPKKEVEHLLSQAGLWEEIESKTLGLASGEAINFLAPRGINPGEPEQGVSFGQIVNIDGQLYQQFQLLPFRNKENIKRFEEMVGQGRKIVDINGIKKREHFSPLLTWVVQGKPVDFKNELFQFIETAKQPLVKQDIQYSFLFNSGFNIYGHQNPILDVVQDGRGLLLSLSERSTLPVTPILIFRNTKTEVQTGLVFERNKKNQETQQRAPIRETLLKSKPYSEPVSMFRIIKKNLERVITPTILPTIPTILTREDLIREDAEKTHAIQERPKPAKVVFQRFSGQQPAGRSPALRTKDFVVFSARALPLPVEKGEEAEPLIALARDNFLVIPETPRKTVTVPLIEIPINRSMIYIKAKLEPVEKNTVGGMVEAAEKFQEAEPNEPVFLVKNFAISRLHISIDEENRRKPEIKKLRWVINLVENGVKPIILEFELPKDLNQRLYAFLHFLRKVVKKELTEDILWQRQISLIRADEPVDEPLEILEEIEYYLSLLKSKTYAQIFASVN